MKNFTRQQIRAIFEYNTNRGSIETGFCIWVMQSIDVPPKKEHLRPLVYFIRESAKVSELSYHPIESKESNFYDRISEIVEEIIKMQKIKNVDNFHLHKPKK